MGRPEGRHDQPVAVAKENDDPDAVWKEILDEVDGDISLETTEPQADAMYEQGVGLAAKAPNAVVKVPMTPDGLQCGKRLTDEGIRINVTLVFSPAQAILAAEIGAYIVSPFLGRLDDVGSDGMYMLRQICEIYAVQGYETNVLAASLRHPMHVIDAALAGADIATHAVRRLHQAGEASTDRSRPGEVPGRLDQAPERVEGRGIASWIRPQTEAPSRGNSSPSCSRSPSASASRVRRSCGRPG